MALRAFSDLVAGAPPEVVQRTARAALVEPGPSGWPQAPAAFCLALTGDVPGAVAGLDRVLAEAGPTGWTSALTGMLRSLLLADIGDAAGAVDTAGRAVAALGTADAARAVLAHALYRAGDLPAAVRALPAADPVLPLLALPVSLVVRAAAAEHTDRFAALIHLTRCGNLLAELGVENPLVVPWWVDAARLTAATGDPRTAALLTARAAAWPTSAARGLALLADGMAALGARTGLAAATDTLADAVDVLGGTSLAWWLTRAELALAEAHLQAADRASARRHFRSAADRATRCGYRALAIAAHARLVAAGGRLHRVPGAPDVLTTAERRVAELALTGATNREISERLLITVRTVETHLTNLYRKLSVPGRAGLHTAIPEAERPAAT